MFTLQGKSMLLGCSLAVFSAGTMAQEARKQANEDDPGTFAGAGPGVEEIVVSARKRDENIQEVPIAIAVLDADAIEKLNIRDVADVSKYTPSVQFNQGFAAQDTRITIRGLAPTRGRQNVAVLVDGIDVTGQAVQTNGGSLLINTRLFDVERIEVLKGPQNALYGRTAFAGAISYITKEPNKEELDGQVYADVGNNNRFDLRASVSGPLVADKLYGGINVAGWEDDGFYDNSVTGANVGGRDGAGISGALVWDITERFSARLRAEYSDEDIEQSPYTAISPATPVSLPGQAYITPPGGTAPVLSPDAPRAINSVVGTLPTADGLQVTLSQDPRTGKDYPGVTREITRASLILNYDFGPATLVSLTGAGNAKVDSFEDARREGSMIGSLVGGEFEGNDETKQFSQELRLVSNGDGPFAWTIGALYWKEDVDFLDGGVNCILNPAIPIPGYPAECGAGIAPITGAARFADPWTRDSKHWSVYGLFDWSFADNWSFIFEGRYADEKLSVSGPDRAGTPSPFDDRPRAIGQPFGQTALQPAYGTIYDSVDDDFFAPKVTLRWTPTDNSMYYLSWAQAYKPEGISIVAALTGFNPETSDFDQEELTVYELGGKTSWQDNRWILNGALFYQDFSDKQVSTQQIVGGTLLPVPVNASSADIVGVELETSWQATDALNLYASYTYLYSNYGSFEVQSTGAGSISRAGNCDVVVEDTTAGPRSVCNLDLSGRDLEFVPENSVVAGFEYRRGVSANMDWFLGGDYIYQDDRWLNPENTVKLGSYSTVDLRLGLAAEAWDVLLYVNNALENDVVQSSFGNTANKQLASYGVGPGSSPPFTFWLPSNQTPILPNQRSFGARAVFRF